MILSNKPTLSLKSLQKLKMAKVLETYARHSMLLNPITMQVPKIIKQKGQKEDEKSGRGILYYLFF